MQLLLQLTFAYYVGAARRLTAREYEGQLAQMEGGFDALNTLLVNCLHAWSNLIARSASLFMCGESTCTNPVTV